MAVKKYSSLIDQIIVGSFTMLIALCFIGILQWQCLEKYKEEKELQYGLYQAIQVALLVATIVVLVLGIIHYTKNFKN